MIAGPECESSRSLQKKKNPQPLWGLAKRGTPSGRNHVARGSRFREDPSERCTRAPEMSGKPGGVCLPPNRKRPGRDFPPPARVHPCSLGGPKKHETPDPQHAHFARAGRAARWRVSPSHKGKRVWQSVGPPPPLILQPMLPSRLDYIAHRFSPVRGRTSTPIPQSNFPNFAFSSSAGLQLPSSPTPPPLGFLDLAERRRREKPGCPLRWVW